MPFLQRMIHEKHGEHICYSQVEVDSCLAHGWQFKPEQKQELAAPPKKRGRPKKGDK